MEVHGNEFVDIDVKEMFFILLHKLWLIAIIGILFATCAGLASIYLITPTYASTACITIVTRQDVDRQNIDRQDIDRQDIDRQDIGRQNADRQDADQQDTNQQEGTLLILSEPGLEPQLTGDYRALLKSVPVLERALGELKLNLSPDELAGMVSVEPSEDARRIEVTVNHGDPVMAKQLADAIAGAALGQSISMGEMKGMDTLEEGNLPHSPSSPNLCKNMLLGAFGGIVFSLGFLALGRLWNSSAYNAEDIEKCLGKAAFCGMSHAGGRRRKGRKGIIQ